jgi:hypothetical protein
VNHPSDPSSNGKVLEQIASDFSRFRKGVGGHYPELLRSMAISAAGMGLSRKCVAKAAGISTATMNNWAAKGPRAKQLKVITTATAVSALGVSSPRDLVCIRLVSGVEIDFPRMGLSTEFLETLNTIGGSR